MTGDVGGGEVHKLVVQHRQRAVDGKVGSRRAELHVNTEAILER